MLDTGPVAKPRYILPLFPMTWLGSGSGWLTGAGSRNIHLTHIRNRSQPTKKPWSSKSLREKQHTILGSASCGPTPRPYTYLVSTLYRNVDIRVRKRRPLSHSRQLHSEISVRLRRAVSSPHISCRRVNFLVAAGGTEYGLPHAPSQSLAPEMPNININSPTRAQL